MHHRMFLVLFLFKLTAPTELYTLSLHDALPISFGTTFRLSHIESIHERSRLRREALAEGDRKSTRLNSSHVRISYVGFCLKKNKAQLPGKRARSDLYHHSYGSVHARSDRGVCVL